MIALYVLFNLCLVSQVLSCRIFSEGSLSKPALRINNGLHNKGGDVSHARFRIQNVSGKSTVFRCRTSTTYRREPPYNPVIPFFAQHFAKNCFAITLECRLNASPYLKPA
jgi:hypothetical protein